jgi:hypothetical protein
MKELLIIIISGIIGVEILMMLLSLEENHYGDNYITRILKAHVHAALLCIVMMGIIFFVIGLVCLPNIILYIINLFIGLIS